MGGCKCTYRTCNIKSDGVTHMYHYPVFDKIRCHQWLVNAQRLEFLNLKVSQLKNRVVCQHHFTDDNFMNYMKFKLKFDAIPTVDGPYCDTTSSINKEEVETYMVTTDDIENDFLMRAEKKANYSVKYVDFLTSCDMSFLNNIINEDNNDTAVVSNERSFVPYSIKSNSDDTNHCVDRCSDKLKFQYDSSTCIVSPTLKPASIIVKKKVDNKSIKNMESNTGIKLNNSVKEEPRVKIISEKRIEEPFKLPLQLQPVSPSIIIQIPKKTAPVEKSNRVIEVKQKQNYTANVEPAVNINPKKQKSLNDNLTFEVELLPLPNSEEKTIKVHIPQHSNYKESEQNKVTLLKNKISPQRIAAIKEKRKFNMKLKDIVESCLNNGNTNKIKELKPVEVCSAADKTKETDVSTNFSSKTKQSSIHEYTIAYLEARMKKMENTLLNRIDQNTKKISELSIKNDNNTTSTRSTLSQTISNDEHYKKYLYKEISKYLSPSTSSKVYEEMFIDKYSIHNNNIDVEVNETHRELPKRKRRRLR